MFRRSVLEKPDRPFHKFSAGKSIYRRTLFSKETSIARLWNCEMFGREAKYDNMLGKMFNILLE